MSLSVLEKWLLFLKAFELFCLKLWRILSKLFRYLTFFEGLSRWCWNFTDVPSKAVCQFTPAVLFKLFVNSKLSFGSHIGAEPVHAHSSFSYLSLIFTHPYESTVVWDIKTIKSQPASEDCGRRETLHASKYLRKGWSSHVNIPSLLFKWQRVGPFSLHVILRCFFVSFYFVKSTFKIVMFCSKLFFFSKGRF